MSSRDEENDMDGQRVILDEFRKKNQWNQSSYEGDIDCARWLFN